MAKDTGSDKSRPEAQEERKKKSGDVPDREELEKNRRSDRTGTAGEREVDPWS